MEARVRSSGATALALAAAAGHRDVVELLLQSGASAGARDGAGATALCVAALRGQLGAVEPPWWRASRLARARPYWRSAPTGERRRCWGL